MKFLPFCLEHCFKKEIFHTAIKTSLVVGTILALINHYDSIITMSLGGTQIIQIILTYFVPYSVATYAGTRHAFHMYRVHGVK
jgi:hypothetical protein